MKSPLTSPFGDRGPSGATLHWTRSGGFTLVELMVAMAVLVLIVGMMSSLLATMNENWLNAQKRVNNFTKARAMLDMMAHDLQSGVFRSDLPAFPGGADKFYTLRPGIGSGSPSDLRYVSAVEYAFASTPDTSVLQRSDEAIVFSDSSGLTFGPSAVFPTATPRDTAPGIIDFKLVFVQQDGTITLAYAGPGAANPTRVVGVTLAVVDDQTMQILKTRPGNPVTTLRGALDSIVPGPVISGCIKTSWDQYLNTTLNWKSYPQSMGIGFSVFERYVVLPSSP